MMMSCDCDYLVIPSLNRIPFELPKIPEGNDTNFKVGYQLCRVVDTCRSGSTSSWHNC